MKIIKISKKDLYELKESEIINIIKKSKYNKIFEIWKNSDELCKFRKKEFLPEKCHLCPMIEQCGGACPISRSSKEFYSEDYMSLLRGKKND